MDGEGDGGAFLLHGVKRLGFIITSRLAQDPIRSCTPRIINRNIRGVFLVCALHVWALECTGPATPAFSRARYLGGDNGEN